jgi:HSP20 family protein
MLLNHFSPLRLLEMGSPLDVLGELTGARPMFAPTGYPALNCWSDDTNFYVEAELPGIDMNDLEILVDRGSLLSIKGRRNDCQCESGKWLRRERGYGEFQRRMELPGPVAEEDIEATLKNGVLLIKLPKAPQIRPRKVEVKAA